jgi:dihydrofolate synthase/folylpolyglutamate synthase
LSAANPQGPDEFFDWSSATADPFAWLGSLVDFEASAPSISAGVVEGLSLEPIRQIMAVLGDPQADYKVIHVTGTNGKGSVTAMIAGLVEALGLSVGAYTSPDQGLVNERIAANGEHISDEQLRLVLGEVANAAQISGVEPTRFEALTAAALTWFSTIAVDVAVVEVGLLGRFDATNVVSADVAVITSLGKDHTEGDPGWERRVLDEKAGIIEADSTVVVGGVDPSLRRIVEAEGPAEVLWPAPPRQWGGG